jgi:hypothetical protein
MIVPFSEVRPLLELDEMPSSQLFKHPMQCYLPLSCLGFQQADPVWPDANKPPQVSLGCLKNRSAILNFKQDY